MWVTRPHPVRLGHIEPLLHTIGRRHRWLAITLSMPPAIAGLGTQSFIAHQAVGVNAGLKLTHFLVIWPE